MSEKSIFTKIIEGELPAHFVYKDKSVVAFMTNEPITRGHILVVPKMQVDHIWDLPDDDYQRLMSVAKLLGAHLREKLGAKRTIMAVEGFQVPHVHVHLIPANAELDNLERLETPSQDELAEVAKQLRLY